MRFPEIPCVFWEYWMGSDRSGKVRERYDAHVNPAEVQYVRTVTDRQGSYTEIALRSGAHLHTDLERAGVMFLLDHAEART